MLNQSVLVGKICKVERRIADKGISVLFIDLDMGDTITISIQANTLELAAQLEKYCPIGSILGAKCHLETDSTGDLCAIIDKATFISSAKEEKENESYDINRRRE